MSGSSKPGVPGPSLRPPGYGGGGGTALRVPWALSRKGQEPHLELSLRQPEAEGALGQLPLQLGAFPGGTGSGGCFGGQQATP